MGSPEIDLSELMEEEMREKEMKVAPSSIKKAGIIRSDRGSAGRGRGGSLQGAAAIFGTNRENFALRARREVGYHAAFVNQQNISSLVQHHIPLSNYPL